MQFLVDLTENELFVYAGRNGHDVQPIRCWYYYIAIGIPDEAMEYYVKKHYSVCR